MIRVARLAAWEELDDGGLMISSSPYEPILQLGPPSAELWNTVRALSDEIPDDLREAVELFTELGMLES